MNRHGTHAAAALFGVAIAAAITAAGLALAEDTVGVPATVEKRATQTVDQIMERDRLLPPPHLRSPRAVEQELEDHDIELREDPDAPPPMSHWPPIPDSFSGVLAPGDPPNLPQTIGTSFRATTRSEGGAWFPPDSMGDVGPTQVLIHVNGRVKVLDKTGSPGPLNADTYAFWAPVLLSNYPGDPQVRYDRLSGRWFVLSTDFGSANNQILLAVSSGPIITGSASFTYYAFRIGNVLPADSALICDYPSLGVDANALYVGCNMFDGSFSAFQYPSAYVIRKSSVLAGGPMFVTGFSNMGATGNSPFAPRGVDNDDPTWTEGYFIGTDPSTLNRINIRRILDPGGTPTLGSGFTIPISSNTLATQLAMGSQPALHPTTLRLFAASIHKNKISGVTSLWTAHSVQTDTTCTPQMAGSGSRLGAKWYEIGTLTGTPAITQFGTLCTTAGGGASLNSQRGFLMPTVIASGQGHMALAASYASATEFAGVAAAGRLRTDPLGGTRAPETIVLAGLASYNTVDNSARNRWGDYSFTDVDPNDDQTIWTFQEYADTPADNWSVRAVQLKAPPPPPVISSTNPVCLGGTAVPVTVVGADSCAAPTCTNGLCTGGGGCPEFFDPGPDTGGPGYANHISAMVSGGVTVNSANIVIPANPATQRVNLVALSLNTTATTPGTKNVTIVNPDGQSSMGTNRITVVANRNPVVVTGSYSICQDGSIQLNGSGSSDPDAACADSIVSYEWDLNNDATFDITGPTPTVTYAQLGSLGLVVGSNTIKLRVTDTHAATTTGTGTITLIAEGGGCNDANACTPTDTCQSGICTDANPVVCTPSDPCHVAGVCNTGTGACSNPNAPDGTGCNDPDPCVSGETCTAGVCGGGVPAPPGELQNARFTDETTLVWDSIPNSPSYDVLRGEIGALPVGPGSADEDCFDNLAVASLPDTDPVPPGSGFWYLIRAETACGVGGYGTQKDLTPRTSTTCP